MAKNREPLVGLDELARLLETHEGPDAVRRRTARRRMSGGRLTWSIAAGALVAGSGLGFGLGASVTPSGSAASAPTGLGFLPASEWFVLQSGEKATPGWPMLAIAANVPFRPEDVSEGVPDYYWLPFRTLADLPAKGVVIVATFTPRGEQPWTDRGFPARSLPLRVRDAEPFARLGAAARPGDPLGAYELRAAVNGHNVDLEIYFGTRHPSRALAGAAQRQLDRLFVRPAHDRRDPTSEVVDLRPLPEQQATPSPRVLDRTFVCSTTLVGGIREISAIAQRGGARDGSTSWHRPAIARITSGPSTSGGPDNPSLLNSALVWAVGGRPTADATLIDHRLLAELYRVRAWGTLAVNRSRCRPSTTRVALGQSGLSSGGRLGPFGDEWECPSPRRVVVRLRATLAEPAPLKTYRQFLRTTVPTRSAELAVRTEAGRPLVYADVSESGRARLFVSRACS